ncbi:MAG TPA: multicopper oxidase domain-containing protein [Candidatus Baltobacteraceae bacterium]
MARRRTACFGAIFAMAVGALIVPLATIATTGVPMPAILANDNRLPAGLLSRHELRLSLAAVWGRWYPDGPRGAFGPMQAFAQNGQAPQIPGPLIRVPVGTAIVVRVRNDIPGTHLTVHGLMNRPALRDHPFDVPYGQTRLVRFAAAAVGTYYYWGSTTGAAVSKRYGADSQLSGAIVVDPPHPGKRPSPDRIFVIGQWDNVLKAHGNPNFNYELDVINGRSWPYTEKLSYARGSTVRWRWIDPAFGAHPLHLHGFYFRVDSRGDGTEDVTYKREADRDQRVTELIEPGHTFAMSWNADRAGSWLFHCHLTYHVMAHRPISQMLRPPVHLSDEDDYLRHAMMGGLILQVAVRGRSAVQAQPARRVKLVVAPAPDDGPANPSFEFTLEENGKATVHSVAVAPAIVLTRDVPVAIDVVNRLHESTSIHWHGMELDDSYYDGVPGYSGQGVRRAPLIASGGAFEARMTPPRAGTFIYHTHKDDIFQLRGGLAGPLIVLPPGQTFDPSTDYVFTIAMPSLDKGGLRVFINGGFQPPPLVVRAGVRQRLRFINMTTYFTHVMLSLSVGGRTATWQPLAVDGADLAAMQQSARSAVDTVTIGQTRDYAFVPKRGNMLLQIWPAPSLPAVSIPVRAI